VEAEETRKRLVAASYTSWQQGAGGKKTFGEYISGLGLSEKLPKLNKKQQRKLAIRGINTARRILKIKIKKKKI